MKYNPDIHHRRSMRLKEYDYCSGGVYFVTIRVQDRLLLFGDVAQDEIKLNDTGKMATKWWLGLTNKFPSVETDEYVVMPNHFHGILTIVGADLRVRPGPGPIHPDPTCPNLVGPGLIGLNAGA